MSTQFIIAITAGVICGIVVAAYFVAIDQTKTVPATNGPWTPQPKSTSYLQQFEALARPPASSIPAHATGPLRQKLSRAGDPGNLTPAGFQAVRYGLAALFAIVGLGLGLLLRLPVPTLVLAPAAGAVAGVLGFMSPRMWLDKRFGLWRPLIECSLAEATHLLTLVVSHGLRLEQGV